MKINGINIQNFKGIDSLNHQFKKKVTVLHGPVGAGKTSFIQALRFGITGESPTQPIKSGESRTNIILDCGEELCIEREIMRPNKKNIKIVGRKVGVGASEEHIQKMFQVGNEVMKIATSSEVLTRLKPSEFGSIFLDESKEKRKYEELLNLLKKLDIKEKKTLMDAGEKEEDTLPADAVSEIKRLFINSVVTLEDVSKAYDEARFKKKEYTALHKNAISRAKDFLEIVKPEYSESEIKKKMEEIIGVEKNIKDYEQAVKDYDKALINKNEQEKRIAKLQFEIDSNNAALPNEEKNEKNKEKIELLNKRLVEQERLLQTLTDNVKRLRNIISQLDKPICPISNKLVCKTDKTSLNSELEKGIEENEDAIKTTKELIDSYAKEIKELKAVIEKFQKNKELYNKKILMKKELDQAIAHPVPLPKKPEKFESKKDYREEKAELQEKLDLLRRYNDSEIEYKESLRLKRLCDIFDFITKALEPKGPIIKDYLDSFVEFLEISCNERATLLKTGFETKFILDDGLKVLFKTNKGMEFLPLSNLSNGEQLFAGLILTDLVNSFCNSRILILDNTDHLDENSFRDLLTFVTRTEIQDLYDNIIISYVNHDDMLAVAEEFETETETISF